MEEPIKDGLTPDQSNHCCQSQERAKGDSFFPSLLLVPVRKERCAEQETKIGIEDDRDQRSDEQEQVIMLNRWWKGKRLEYVHGFQSRCDKWLSVVTGSSTELVDRPSIVSVTPLCTTTQSLLNPATRPSCTCTNDANRSTLHRRHRTMRFSMS